MDKKIAIHTMELWLANLPVVPGHVQHGTRPVVIVSNDIANNFSPIVTVVPLTTNRKAATLPTHVCLRGYGLAATSIAKCEQVMALDKSCLIRRLGEVSDWYDRLAIQHALAEQFGGTFATEDQLTTALSFMLGTLRATREKEARHE